MPSLAKLSFANHNLAKNLLTVKKIKETFLLLCVNGDLCYNIDVYGLP
jgi:hypothetical protein